MTNATMHQEDLGKAVHALLARRAVARGLANAAGDAHIDAAIERLLEQDVRTPEPTDEECSRYYAVHPEEFTSGTLVFARHILFAVTPGAPLARIRAQAEQVLHDVRTEPARFAEFAERFSNCPSGKQGGSLGQLGRGDSVPEFERALFDASTLGVLPHLVHTRYGFHVVAVDQRIPGQLVPFELVRERIAACLRRTVEEKALIQYVKVIAGEEGVALPGIVAAATPLVQ
ncbi:MAG TPA: peptidylprolyl isomerase [Burkholderiales bacterium]|nr:peptidylprolyl isomerase [Burkholderiales bacterium]